MVKEKGALHLVFYLFASLPFERTAYRYLHYSDCFINRFYCAVIGQQRRLFTFNTLSVEIKETPRVIGRLVRSASSMQLGALMARYHRICQA